ncbi:MAG: methionine synthase [Planctomycetes bacterium]|nr:methionine synthase [Planctomycetota bacterium]
MGTTLQKFHFKAPDFGGPSLDGCNDWLCQTRPDVITEIHEKYLEAGADGVETNTFGSSRFKLDEYKVGDRTYDQNVRAASLARAAADRFSTPDRPRFVAGSIGPSGFLPSSEDPSLGNVAVDRIVEGFLDQVRGLADGGADAFLIETSQDILEVKAQIFAVRRWMKESGKRLPILAQVTLDRTGRMLLGTDIGASLTTLLSLGADIVGLNCSTGPEEMRDSVAYLAEKSPVPISIMPNAGIPANEGTGDAVYPLGPAEFAEAMEEFVRSRGIAIAGGCCGTTYEHIRLLAERVRGAKPLARTVPYEPSISSMMKSVPLHQYPKPLLVGERVNAQGSRKLKELLIRDDWPAIVAIARAQVEGGSHALDVCVALNERDDEKAQMTTLLRKLAHAVDAPVVIDSTEYDVVGEALKVYPGRAIVNSVNLEKGLERWNRVMPMVKEYGAAVLAMTIDEQGMALTTERKFDVARRMYEQARDQFGIAPDSLIFDCLTFTLATGSPEYVNSAIATIEAIRRIKDKLPGALTGLGVSNVSFGLAPGARAVLNSVFLTHCVHAGLDIALVHPNEILPYPSIPENERELAENLVFNRYPDALAKFIEHFEKSKSKKKAPPKPARSLTVEEQLHFNILNRIQEGLEPLLDEALKKYPPVGVINEVLLGAMKEVGDRMATGELILPFVLQSAEVMKKSVAYLEKFMDREDSYTKGTIVLGTVYGDVHDIGKNLVKTILTNNGYTVHDLGKQVPVQNFIQKAKESKADAIGLSALLVSTSKQMPYCVQELDKHGLHLPVIIGGAAINSRFGKKACVLEDGRLYPAGVFYCTDAFTGLDAMNDLVVAEKRRERVERNHREVRALLDLEAGRGPAPALDTAASSAPRSVKSASHIPVPPFWGARTVPHIDLREIFPLIDRKSLFRLSWGGHGKSAKDVAHVIREEFEPLLGRMEEEALREKWFEPRAVYGFFPARTRDSQLVVFDADDPTRERARFDWPRQPDGERLCLVDYWDGDRQDVAAFQVVTVGPRATELCDALNAKGEYSKSYYLHGLAVETAEAMAEWLHRRLKVELGMPHGGGKRYSPGYPSCPDLADNARIFDLLEAEKAIGTSLTSAFQIVPEQSTCAIVAHHPDAKYYNIKGLVLK